MEPIRVSIVFDATGQMQLRRGADELGRLTNQLATLAANSGSAGRVFRQLEGDLNRFSNSLHRVTSSGLILFNNVFERTYSLLSSFGRITFYTAIGQIAGLAYGFRSLTREFFRVNEQFAGLEITLKSVFGSLQSARKIREELARITITSPLPFKDLANAVRAAAVMPALTQRLSLQASTNTLGAPQGFLNQYRQLLEQLTTFRPDKMTEDAVFALREALTGELRSLIRRFEFPSSLLVQASGQPLDKLKRQPELMFEAIKTAMNKIISPEAIREIAKQPSKLFENILEQAVQIPLLRIGRAGEDQGKTSFYQKIIDSGFSLLNRLGEFANADRGAFGPQSNRISASLIRAFDNISGKFDTVIEKVLSALGVGQLDRPGSSRIERVYLLFERAINLVADEFPPLIDKFIDFGERAIPVISKFVNLLWTIVTAITSLFSFNPLAGLAGLVALRSLPTLVNNALGLIEGGFIKTLTNIRSSIVSGSIGPNGLANAVIRGQSGMTYNAATGQFTYGPGSPTGAPGGVVPRNLVSGFPTSTLNAFGLTNAQRLQAQTGLSFVNGAFVNAAGNAVRPSARQLTSVGFNFGQGADLNSFLASHGVRLDQTGRLRSIGGPTPGSFVSPNAIFGNAGFMSAGGAPVGPLGARGTYSQYYSNLRNAGQGRISSGLVSAVAGGAVGLGLGQGAAGALATGAGALVSVLGPILLTLAATGFFTALLDKASDYFQRRRDAELTQTRKSLGVSDSAITSRSQRLGAEISFGRTLDQFLIDAKTSGGLKAGFENASDFGSVTVRVPNEFKKLVDVGLLSPDQRTGAEASKLSFWNIFGTGVGSRGSGPSLTTGVQSLAASSFQDKRVDLPGLIALRTNIQNDLRALTEATSGDFFKTAGAKLELASSQFKDDAGNLTSVVVNTSEEAVAAIRELKKVFDTTTTQVDSFVQSVQNVYKTSSGKDLISFGVALEDATRNQFDRFTETLQSLDTEAGFLGRSRQFDNLREKMKSYEDSPDLRLIVEQSEGIFSSFRDTFDPLFKVTQIFDKETPRIKTLKELQDSLLDLKTGKLLDDAIKEQVDVIDQALAFYGQTFGEKFADNLGREQLRVRVERLDEAGKVIRNAATGLPETVLVAWDDWAKQIKEKLLTKTGGDILRTLDAQTRDALIKIPLNVIDSVSLTLSQLFDGIEGATKSTTDRLVSQAEQGLSMYEKLASNVPNLFPNVTNEVGAILNTLKSIPELESARTPIERDLIGFQRLGTVVQFFSQLGQSLEDLRSITPLENQSELTFAIEKTQVGVAKFTSKLSEVGDKLRELADQLNFEASQSAFESLISGKSFFDTPTEQLLTNQRIGAARGFAQRRFGVNLSDADFAFSRIASDEFAPNTRRPFAREEGLLEFLRKFSAELGRTNTLLNAQAELQKAEQGTVDSTLAASLARSNAELAGIKVGIAELERTTILGIDRFVDSNRKESAALLQGLIDEAGLPKAAQSGRISSRLQSELSKFGGSDFALDPQFLSALGEDLSGGNSTSGKLKQLEAFGTEYARLADLFDQRALDLSTIKGVDTEAVKSLEAMALNFRKLADEAQRTKEQITGRGGVFNSFIDGFQEVNDSWAATASNWTSVGAEMARSLSTQLSDSLFDVIVKAKDAGEAFRAFGQSIAETAAKLAINKTVETLLGAAFKGIGALANGFSSGSNSVVGTVNGPEYGPGFSDTAGSFGVQNTSALSNHLPSRMSFNGGNMVQVNVPLTVNSNGNNGGQQSALDADDTQKRAEMFSKGLQAMIQDYTIRQTRQGGVLKQFIRGGGR